MAFGGSCLGNRNTGKKNHLVYVNFHSAVIPLVCKQFAHWAKTISGPVHAQTLVVSRIKRQGSSKLELIDENVTIEFYGQRFMHQNHYTTDRIHQLCRYVTVSSDC